MNSSTSHADFRLAGLVLCGGRSSRMGQDKAGLYFRGEPMLSRCCRRLAAAAEPIVAVAAPDQQLPSLPSSVSVVRDAEPHQGPLAGLLTGLQAIAAATADDRQTTCVALCSCDLPFLDARILHTMAGVLATSDLNMQCHVLKFSGKLQPQHSVWKLSAVSELRAIFEQGERSLKSAIAASNPLISDAETFRSMAAPEHFLTDVNRPQQFAEAINRTAHDQSTTDAAANDRSRD